MKAYRHLRHVLVTMRNGHDMRKDTSLKTLIDVCERVSEKKGER